MEGGGGGRDDTMRATQLRTHDERRNSGKSSIMVSTTGGQRNGLGTKAWSANEARTIYTKNWGMKGQGEK